MHVIITLSISMIFIVLLSCLDGMRDGMIKRREDVGWWQYHLIKWMSFYPPLVLIWCLTLSRTGGHHAIISTLMLMVLSWIAWQVGAHLTGPSYTSWLFTILGNILHSKDGKRNEY